MQLGTQLVDQWWWQASLVAAQVAATIVGVYVALRHDRATRRAEASQRAADAVRPIIRRVAYVLDATLWLGLREDFESNDPDRDPAAPLRVRLRRLITKVVEDCVGGAGSQAHHLAQADLKEALRNAVGIVQVVDRLLLLAGLSEAVLERAEPHLRVLHGYVEEVDRVLVVAALGQRYSVPGWARAKESLGQLERIWYDSVEFTIS